MLQLLNPIGLLAATAVLIPILVHLWRERTGKTLRIGSTSLLSNSNRSRSNSLRIHQWPLFLLRCLLVLLLAFLLAKPIWQRSPIAGTNGWILVPKTERHLAYSQYKTLIDSLLAARWELHDLGEGFNTFTITQPLDTATGTGSREAGAPRIYIAGEVETADIDTWALLSELDTRLPAAYPVQVFTSNRLAQYQGARPGTSLALQWHSYAPADTMITTNMAAWISPKQELKTLVQKASEAGISYATASAAVPPMDIAVDTSILHIALYPGNNAADARYLKAALEAIGEVNERRFGITTLNDNQSPAVPQHVIFQLTTAPPLPLSALREGGILFRYDTGRVSSLASWQQAAGVISIQAIDPPVYRYAAGNSQGRPVWTLGNGQALLTVQDTAGKQVYHFKGRFTPAAGDLVWSPDFAQQLLPLVLATPATGLDTDIRHIDNRQVIPTLRTAPRPIHTTGRSEATTGKEGQTDLTSLIALFIISVFAIERYIVYRQQNHSLHA